MKLTPLYFAYKCLDNIYRIGAYSGIELNKYINNAAPNDKAVISKLVYGVLDKDIELSYIIKRFTVKVKPSVMPVLKLGVYEIKYMDLPDYATVNECVKLAGDIGKKELKGFINATLRKIANAISSNEITLPENEYERLSVRYSFPLWAVERLIQDRGRNVAEDFMAFEPNHDFTNIRINTKLLNCEKAEKLFEQQHIEFKKTCLNGVYSVRTDKLLKIGKKLYTIMSLGSMLVCEAVEAENGDKVLDVCAAPGGKSVYLSQTKGAEVTACELHEHRAELIRSYAERMSENINILVKDATVQESKFIETFDKVLCDVPCSGFGVVFSKPDIKLNRKNDSIKELAKLQLAILKNSSTYVKVGGKIVYSTCTVFKEENECVVEKFLKENKDFVQEKAYIPKPFDIMLKENGQALLLPMQGLNEGFFISVMKRVG